MRARNDWQTADRLVLATLNAFGVTRYGQIRQELYRGDALRYRHRACRCAAD